MSAYLRLPLTGPAHIGNSAFVLQNSLQAPFLEPEGGCRNFETADSPHCAKKFRMQHSQPIPAGYPDQVQTVSQQPSTDALNDSAPRSQAQQGTDAAEHIGPASNTLRQQRNASQGSQEFQLSASQPSFLLAPRLSALSALPQLSQQPPQEWLCPISLELMLYPVTLVQTQQVCISNTAGKHGLILVKIVPNHFQSTPGGMLPLCNESVEQGSMSYHNEPWTQHLPDTSCTC